MKFKIFKQTPDFCGPTCIRMILNHYGIKKSEHELAKIIGATKKDGCTPKQIILGMKKLGIKAIYRKNYSLEKLQNLLIKNIPVIIYWNPRGYGHYSVVVGIDEECVHIADPKMSKIMIFKRTDFLKKWHDIDNKNDKREVIVIENAALI